MERLWGPDRPGGRRPTSGSSATKAPPPASTGPWTPGHAVHHVAYRHQDTNIVFAGRRRRRAHRRRPDPAADAAARNRRRAVARVESTASRPGRRRPWRSRTSARSPTSSATLDDAARRARPLGEPSRREHDASGFEREIRAALAGTPDEHGYLKAMPPETLYGGAGPILEKARYCRVVMSQTIELPTTAGPHSALGGAWRVIVRNDDHNKPSTTSPPRVARLIPGIDVGRGYANRRSHPRRRPGRRCGAGTRSWPSTTGTSCGTRA